MFLAFQYGHQFFNIVQKEPTLWVLRQPDEMLGHDNEAAARALQIAGQQGQHEPVRWVSIEGMEAVEGVLPVKIEVIDVVVAGRFSRGAAAGKGGHGLPVTRFYFVVFEELNGQKGNLLDTPNALNVNVQQSQIPSVQGVVGSLEMKHLQR